jgi:hypothetical protein
MKNRLLMSAITFGLLISTTVKSGEYNSRQIADFFSYQQKMMQEKLYLHLDKPTYAAGDTIWFRGYLLNAVTHSFLVKSNFIYVELYNQGDSLLQRKKIKRDEFCFYNNIVLPPEMPSGNYYIRAYSNWMRNFGAEHFFSRNIRIGNLSVPEKSAKQPATNDFEVTFFPEGGELLTGIPQRVAFKAQQSNGNPIEVRGIVLNAKKQNIAQLVTQHDGMGLFQVTAAAGDKLYAEVTSVQGKTKVFDLPQPTVHACALTVTRQNNTLHYRVLTDATPDSLLLIEQCRGRLLALKTIDIQHLEDTLSLASAPEGIVQLILCQTNGQAISRRLIFLRRTQLEQWTIQKDQSSYSARQPVRINVLLQDENGKPLNGEFSISLTDASQIAPDEQADQIVSNLLLTSDLKGVISHPGWYFAQNDETHQEALDLVMLTHGWCRFLTDNIKQITHPDLPYAMELGQYISGKVHGLPKDEKDNKISAFDPNSKEFGNSTVKANGTFEIDNLQFPDSTGFAVKVLTTRKNGVDIVIDQPDYPIAKNINPYELPVLDYSNYLSSEMKHLNSIGGIRVIQLKEVQVTALKSQNKYFKSSYLITSYGEERIKKEFDMNIVKSGLDVVNDIMRYKYPNRFVAENSDNPDNALLGAANPNYGTTENSHLATSAGFMDATANPNYYGRLLTAVVDDNLYTGEESVIGVLERIDSRDIANMEFISREYNSNNPGTAAVVISLKPGTGLMTEAPDSRIAYCEPLGYAWPAWFYSPKYDNAAQKNSSDIDMRSTVFWDPSMQLGQDGKASFSFYTSDHPTHYHLVIEGVTFGGRVCRYSKNW